MSLYQNGSFSTFNQFICSVMNWFVMLVLPLFQWRRGSFHFFPRWVWRRWFCPRPPLFWPGPTPRLAPVRNCWTIVIILSDIVWQRRRKMTITGKLYCMITPCIKLIIKPFIKVYQCFFRVSQNLQKWKKCFSIFNLRQSSFANKNVPYKK